MRRFGGSGSGRASVLLILVASLVMAFAGSWTSTASADPADWTIEPTPNPEGKDNSVLADISCLSDTNCLAVGYDSYEGRGLAEFWDGTRWTLHQGSPDHRLKAVSCPVAGTCWAVGTGANSALLFERWQGGGSGWGGGGWAPPIVPSGGSGNSINGISCTAQYTCIVVGSYTKDGKVIPLVERLNFFSWTVQEAATTTADWAVLKDVTCSSATQCISVGQQRTGGIFDLRPLAERWDGTRWSALSVPIPAGSTTSGLEKVSCSSASACTAIGTYQTETGQRPFAARWDGTAWTLSTTGLTGTAPLGDVSCPTSTSCIAVDGEAGRTFVQRWDGSNWSTEASPTPEGKTASLVGVSCPSASTCAAVGSASAGGATQTLAVRYSADWTIEPTPNPEGKDNSVLADISCLSDTNCLAVGYDSYEGRGLAEFWDGTRWTLHQGSPDHRLKAVSCPVAGTCWAVGTGANSALLFERWQGGGSGWGGGGWAPPIVPSGGSGNSINGISCTAQYTCIVVGSYTKDGKVIPLVERLNFFSWTVQEAATTTADWAVLKDVTCSSATQCISVGQQRTGGIFDLRPLAERWDGTRWSALSVPIPAGSTTSGLEKVSCSSASACTAIGTYQTETGQRPFAARWDGTAWTLSTTGLTGTAPLGDVSCPTSTSCIAVDGEAGRTFVQRWDGSNWSTEASPTPEGKTASLVGVSCPSASTCAAVGSASAGGATQTLAVQSYEEDTTEPDTTIITGPAGSVSSPDVAFSFEATEINSRFDCSIDAGAFSSCTSPKSFQSLRAGSHVFRVRATDAAANQDRTPAERTFEVIPPDTTITAGPSGTINTTNASFSFEASTPGSTFECSLDAVAFTACASPRSFEGIADGSHVFKVRALDSAGNLDATPAERSFAVDAQPPETTITSPKMSYTSHEQWWVEFTSDDSRATFKCSLDDPNDVPQEPCNSPNSLLYDNHLDPGWHTFVVAATDSAGNTDPSPAKWKFNPEIYPDAPSTSALTSPEEGSNSSGYFTLKAKWGDGPPGGGVNGVSFQWKREGSNHFETIPAHLVLDSSGDPIDSWPLPASQNPGESETVYFNVRKWFHPYVDNDTDIKFRAAFDGGEGAAGASQPVSVVYKPVSGATTDATADIGPATVDLLSGHFTISRTDVSIPVPGTEAKLDFTRVYDSANVKWQTPSKSQLLGNVWQPSVPVEQAYGGQGWAKVVVRHQDAIPAQYEQECWYEGGQQVCEQYLVEDEIPAADWVEVLDNEGGGISFDLVNGAYVAPEYAKEYVLTKAGSTFTLADPDGTQTLFVQNQAGYTNEYPIDSVSWQATPKDVRMVYDASPGAYQRLRMMIAPSPAGVTCSAAQGSNYAPTTPGCRSLTFQYTNSPVHYIHDRLTSITYHNATGSGSQVVAQYEYDANGMLIAEWDPRVTPNLKEQYSYASKLATLTPPGEESWQFNYYVGQIPFGRRNFELRSVSRASLLEDPSVAQMTIVYDVPTSGSEAPYDLSASAIAGWGQSDLPVQATAIFGPDQVPEDDAMPSDYSHATIHYMDADGQEINTATPAPPGVSGTVISTSETDEHGNVIRSLSPQARLLALSDPNPVERSHELETKAVYSADGTKLQEEWGPLHEVKLESGSTVEARMHTTIQYDEGATTPPAGTPMPLLPTTETVGAQVPGQQSDLDQRVTKTDYNWTLRKPTETIVDPSGLNLRTRVIYDESTGLPTERRLPANPDGGDARSTKIIYYTAGKDVINIECGEKPAWANLPCKTLPVAQPGGGNPQLLETRYESYSALDQPTRVIDSPGGAGSPTRTTTITYDTAGRKLRTEQTGGGTAIPPAETVYSSTTGMPEVQRFVCEAPQNCAGFDSQAVTTTYDTLGRVVSYEDADGNVSQAEYDLLGRPVVATDGKGTQTMTYDADSGALVQMTDSAAGTFTAAYDADGNIVAQGLPNGLVAQTTYDEAGAPVHLSYNKVTGCSVNCTWLEFDVEESIHGQWLRQTSNLSAQEYAYDMAGRLTLVKDIPQGGGCTTRSYSFDANSNRTSLITRAPGTGGACDTRSAGTTQNYSYDTADRLVGASITYDNWGRITSLPSAYSGGGVLNTSYYSNDLVHSQTQDGITNTYSLDAALRQRQRTQTGGSNPGTEVYHYAGGSDSPAWIDRGSSWSRNIVGISGLAIQDSANGITFQLANLHGDIVATASADPNATRLLDTFEFDEFGNPKGRTARKYGWLGGKQRRTELSSGVIQMGVRSYVPSMGRFTSVDPVVGGSANNYDYANQDPVNQFDLDGRVTGCTFRLKVHSKRHRLYVRGRYNCPKSAWPTGQSLLKATFKFERRSKGFVDNAIHGKFETKRVETWKPSNPSDSKWRKFGFDLSYYCGDLGREYQFVVKLNIIYHNPSNWGGGSHYKTLDARDQTICRG
jgi:RHS repeat-associated protein